MVHALNKYVLSIHLLLANANGGKMKNEYKTGTLYPQRNNGLVQWKEIMILSKLNTTAAQHTGSESIDSKGVTLVLPGN